MRPLISLIIPVYNDPSGLSDTLTALSKQDYPEGRWETIVVDNNSTDTTLNIAQSFTTHIPTIRVISETRGQSSYLARNRGIQESRGEILAFIDADMTVKPDWLQRGADDIVHGRGDYIGCRVDIYPTQSPPTVWEIYDQRTGFRIHQYIEQGGYAGAGNLFVRRPVIEQIGLFDERLISGGDREFGNRVRDAGFKLYYNHENVMRHPARSTFRSFWNKHYRIGKGGFDLQYFYPERYGPCCRVWDIVSSYHPQFNIWWFLEPPDQKRRQSVADFVQDLNQVLRAKILGVINTMLFAKFCGQMSQYFRRTLGPTHHES